MSVIGLAIFLLWPTSVPVYPVDTTQNAALALLRGVDLSANACPSLHVAFAVYSGVWMARLLREVNSPRAARVVSWLWCVGIVYSTLATRQHVVLDVVAGAILGAAVAVAHLRGLRWYEERGMGAAARPSIGGVPGA
jgi:membrane-associated phospholipid phosphatase